MNPYYYLAMFIAKKNLVLENHLHQGSIVRINPFRNSGLKITSHGSREKGCLCWTDAAAQLKEHGVNAVSVATAPRDRL
jgi:hypothetical protein